MIYAPDIDQFIGVIAAYMPQFNAKIALHSRAVDQGQLGHASRWCAGAEHTPGCSKDTHWIGGNPDKLGVYGWAARSPEAGIVTLRNPSKDVQRSRLSFAHAFELGIGSVTSYKVHGAWSDAMDWPAGGSHNKRQAIGY